MLLALRAAFYAVVFIGLVLIKVPGWLQPGLALPASAGWPQLAGGALIAAGAALILWCIAMFVTIGRGTQAPFDPPRRLVVRGPYAVVRNPMYLGAALALVGAGVFFEALPLVYYASLLLGFAHVMVVSYEEPTLREMFGDSYSDYCAHVRRWLPLPLR